MEERKYELGFLLFLEKWVVEWFMGLGEVLWLRFAGHLVQCRCISRIPTAAFIAYLAPPSVLSLT